MIATHPRIANFKQNAASQYALACLERADCVARLTHSQQELRRLSAMHTKLESECAVILEAQQIACTQNEVLNDSLRAAYARMRACHFAATEDECELVRVDYTFHSKAAEATRAVLVQLEVRCAALRYLHLHADTAFSHSICHITN